MADLDGDGFSETGVFFNGEWRIDINGDGIDEIGIYQGGTWYFDLNRNGAWDKNEDLAFGKFGGEPGDGPVIENIR